MRVSLIITTYNWVEALELSILSALNQTTLPDEIVIADDGSDNRTKEMIDKISKKSIVNIVHSWQEDRGFRASSSRNKAIVKSSYEYIILIDGDMILDKEFIKEHKEHSQKGCFIQGSRVLLNHIKSKEVLLNKNMSFNFLSKNIDNRINAIHSKILSKTFMTITQEHRGIKTCNLSFFRVDCIDVNGFNEDFVGWGREDSEFVERLYNYGIKRKNIKFNCIAYHIWHNENSRVSLKKNDTILNNTIVAKLKWCDNGIDKYIKGTK